MRKENRVVERESVQMCENNLLQIDKIINMLIYYNVYSFYLYSRPAGGYCFYCLVHTSPIYTYTNVYINTFVEKKSNLYEYVYIVSLNFTRELKTIF